MYATYRQKAAAKSIEDAYGMVVTACIRAFMWDLHNIKKIEQTFMGIFKISCFLCHLVGPFQVRFRKGKLTFKFTKRNICFIILTILDLIG